MTGVVRAIRGATTVDEDTREQIEERTQALVREILERNELSVDDLVSIIFTVTSDIRSQFPATGARSLGLDDVALLGATEATIEGGLERCIRVLVHCYSDKSRSELCHVYLEGAKGLREDLAGEAKR